MNKAELIRSVAKRAGIPDINAKLFFEVLLKRLSELLQPGQAADLSGIGYLQLRKGRLQIKEDTDDKLQTESDLNLIVYYEKADAPNENNLIFNIPEIDSQPQDTIEQSFSPSIGKPVIPLSGVKETDYYTPLTGKELKNLVSSRVETLLSEINIIREYTKGSEVLLITPTKYSKDQFEIKWDDLTSDDVEDAIETDVERKADKTKTTEKIEWEFGHELNKQIEEESILDTEKDEVSLVDSKDNRKTATQVGWDFGVTQEDIPETKEIPIKKETVIDEDKPEFKQKEKTKEDLTKTVEDKVPTEEKPEYQKIDTLYERLKAQKGVETDEFDITWSFGETIEKEPTTEEPIKKEIIEEIPRAKHFPDKPIEKETLKPPKPKETKSITDEIIEDKVIVPKSIEATPLAKIEEQKTIDDVTISKEDEVLITKAKPTLTKERIEKRESLERKTIDKRRRTYQHTGTYSKRGSSIPFFIGIFVIITVAVILFSVLTDINLDFLNLTKKQTPVVNKTLFAGTNIIDRSYDIPVSITDAKIAKTKTKQPVVKKNKIRSTTRTNTRKKNTSNIKSNKKKTPIVPLNTSRIKELRETMDDVVKATKNKELNIPTKKENNKTVDPSDNFTFENLPAPIDTAKLHSNIFKDGNTYSVQVSSWKSPQTAESEAAKLKAKGYDAYVAKALIPGRGFWYRVRVRNLKSIRAAEDFLLLNK